MSLTRHTAKHLREVFFSGNWTVTNLRDQTADVTWQQATKKIEGFNTIAALFYHINYYVGAILPVLEGGKLDAHDKYSWEHPPIESEEDWQNMRAAAFSKVEQLAARIEALPDETMWTEFQDPKYGDYYRNLHGLIEHTHYHLGQIALLKKMS